MESMCPNGCGGMISALNKIEDWCPSCRRSLTTAETIVPEDADVERLSNIDVMKAHKLSWCWEWWGPLHHRMRCRLLKGHEGAHDTHQEHSGTLIIATDGEIIRD